MMRKPIRSISRMMVRASTTGFSSGAHITRYYMYQHLSGIKDALSGSRVLSISGSERLCETLGFEASAIKAVSYPEANILNLPFEDEEFDCVVSDQVLEHLKGNPQEAVNECFRVIKPGGFVVHTTCFIYPVHKCPGDYWRFTPDALRLLMEKQGDVIEADGWGNPFIWLYIALGAHHEPIPRSKWHPLNWLATRNNPRWPVVTWVIAKKYAGTQ